MVAALIILDGASEPLRDGRPTSLERAHTPVLDALAATAFMTRLRTIPAGLPAGSETAIPVLLGWVPEAPVDRGLLEAAARGITVPDHHHAWRIDAIAAGGGRAAPAATRRLADEIRLVARDHTVRLIGGHRLLVVGPPPLPVPAGDGRRIWPAGAVPPNRLEADTIVVSAAGAAAGAGRLMGAGVIVPDGATGGLDTDLDAKGACAADAIRSGARRVVVHVGAPDEAAHLLDAKAKVAVIERIDRELIPLILAAIGEVDGVLRICADHGCDPATGMHDAAPVPALTWTPGMTRGRGRARLTERAVAGLPVTDPVWPAVAVTA